MLHMVSALGSRRLGLGVIVSFLSLRRPAGRGPNFQSGFTRAVSIDAVTKFWTKQMATADGAANVKSLHAERCTVA
jgi:hypothetical protein